MAKVANYSRYDALQLQRAKRREIVDRGREQSASVSQAISANINSTAQLQAKISEMQIRTRSQEALKAKMEKINKLA